MNLQARTLITSLQDPAQARPTPKPNERNTAEPPLSFDKAFSAAREVRSQPAREAIAKRDLHESLRSNESRQTSPRDEGRDEAAAAVEPRDRSAEKPERAERAERPQRPERPEKKGETDVDTGEVISQDADPAVAAVPVETDKAQVNPGADQEQQAGAVEVVATGEAIAAPVAVPIELTPTQPQVQPQQVAEAQVASQTVEAPAAATTAPVVEVASQPQVAAQVVESTKAAPTAHTSDRPVMTAETKGTSAAFAEEGEPSVQATTTTSQAVVSVGGQGGAANRNHSSFQQPTGESVKTVAATASTASDSSAPAPSATAPSTHTGAAPTAKADAAPGQTAAAQFSPVPEQNVRDDVNVGRVVRGLQSAVNQRGGSVTLRLTPPELGAVRIELMVKDGVVNARFTAQHESVRNLLMDQMGHLRTALDRQGLTVEKIEVQTNSSSQGSAQQGQQDGANHDGRSAQQYARRQGGEGRWTGQQHGDGNDTTEFDQALAGSNR
ncbi:MAG: flagellar hook-length control protein FliK [Phycisphaeraceae bacterium]